MDNDFIMSYIYEKNIAENELLIKEEDEEKDNEKDNNKKIINYKNLYSLCDNEDHLHICCGLVFSLSLYYVIF